VQPAEHCGEIVSLIAPGWAGNGRCPAGIGSGVTRAHSSGSVPVSAVLMWEEYKNSW
jgi:hypothetical protein